jgi:hypothetical protein
MFRVSASYKNLVDDTTKDFDFSYVLLHPLASHRDLLVEHKMRKVGLGPEIQDKYIFYPQCKQMGRIQTPAVLRNNQFRLLFKN